MRIAFLSDIHANFPALCQALESAERRGADRIVVAGDLVGTGPHPVEVLRLLARREILAVRGNVDRKVLARWADPRRRAKKKSPSAWTARQIGTAEKEFLEGLPGRLDLCWEGVSLLVVHGSPLEDQDFVYPSITPRGLRAKLDGAEPDALVCGHSHLPFTRRVDGVQVVNCGSVGRPIDGDPRGSLALVDLKEGRVARARILRFEFPLEGLLEDLEKRGVPGSGFDHLRGPRSGKGGVPRG